jgi:hypothetical protein
MSAPCVAEIDPGPMLARTGDLLPVPPGLKAADHSKRLRWGG